MTIINYNIIAFRKKRTSNLKTNRENEHYNNQS